MQPKHPSAENAFREYETRLAHHRKQLSYYTALPQIVSYALPLSGILSGVFLYAAFVRHSVPAFLPVLSAAICIAIACVDNRLSRLRRHAMSTVQLYERGLDRLNNDWIGKGNSGLKFLDNQHCHAADLDIFGEGSLFELLSSLGPSADETLARWLCEPASREEILKRQQAILELRNDLNLRERLTQGGRGEKPVEHDLSEWAQARPEFTSRSAPVLAPLLVLITLISAVAWWLGGSAGPFIGGLAIQIVFAGRHRKAVRQIASSTKEAAVELDNLYNGLRLLETSRFASTRLQELQAKLAQSGELSSMTIRQLVGFAELLKQTASEPFGSALHLLLWSTQWAFAIDRWRARFGPGLVTALQIVGEFQSLCCLAAYAFEHPEDPFPEIVEGTPFLVAEEIRHPLLPESECVPNSLSLGRPLQMLVVSGSNMSGKSTLLRTLGTNLVLAQAGAPVRARYLKMSPLAIGAAIRVSDSLRSGSSRFHSEIVRLNQVMELAAIHPTLFLFDEILSGTNSHDRAVGASAVMRGLLDIGALGLVTTHDLALAKVAAELHPRAANVHFRDRIDNGQMTFDYRLHEGEVQTSNALELMRAVGLKI